MDLGFRMHAERTPNPQSIKWVLSEELVERGISAHFREPVGSSVSPLAARLFEVSGVKGVFLASGFVTVTKSEDREWTDLAQPVVDAIKAHVAGDEDTLGPDFDAGPELPAGEIVDRIKDVLETEVRPAVALDGGDVIFAGYQDGVVQVILQGSCVGCPSSTATLRFVIEGRLKEAIPEVERVIQL